MLKKIPVGKVTSLGHYLAYFPSLSEVLPAGRYLR